MPPTPKLTPDLLPYIREQLADGRTYRDIASGLGVHHTTLGAWIAKNAPDLQRAGDRPPSNPSIAEARPMKLVIIDIETMANLAWAWGTWKQDIAPAQIVKHKRVISWAAKYHKSPVKPAFMAEWTEGGREAMVRGAWALLNDADGVIGYNSQRFDAKHLNTEFWVDGITPPAPFAHIDLMKTVKQNFLLGSNKLDSVADRLGIGRKREHEGFALWLKCEAGDADAQKRMQLYNEQDVLLTEKLYRKILPWITNHPSYAAFARSDVPMCSNCGSEAVKPADFHYARTRRYQRYHCTRCGHWMRDRHAEQITEFTETSSY